MAALFDLLTGFIDLCTFIVDFVISTIRDLIYMVGLLGDITTNLPTYLGWLPSQILTHFLLIISIVVIYKIIGREG